MKPHHIRLQIQRNNAASLGSDITHCAQTFVGEASLVHDPVIGNIGQQVQNVLIVKIGIDIVDARLKSLCQICQAGLLCPGLQRFNNLPLSCGTLKVVALGVTDSAVSGGLQAVQQLIAGFRHRRIFTFQGLGNIDLIIVDMLQLFAVYIDVDASQAVDHTAESSVAHRHKLFNVQIQVTVQGLDGLLRAAEGIRRVTLSVLVSDIQIRITINTHQLDIAGVHIDTGNHNTVASTSSVQLGIRLRIHAEQRHVHISPQRTGLVLNGLIHLRSNAQILSFQLSPLGLAVCFGHNQIQYHHHHQNDNDFHRKDNHLPLFLCFMLLCTHFLCFICCHDTFSLFSKHSY